MHRRELFKKTALGGTAIIIGAGVITLPQKPAMAHNGHRWNHWWHHHWWRGSWSQPAAPTLLWHWTEPSQWYSRRIVRKRYVREPYTPAKTQFKRVVYRDNNLVWLPEFGGYRDIHKRYWAPIYGVHNCWGAPYIDGWLSTCGQFFANYHNVFTLCA